MTIKEKIKKLNTGRIGSFGEYIFYRLCKDKKKKIVPYHKERTDFLLNEDKERIDVKTIRSKIDIENSNIFIYNGIRNKSINYAVVDFHKKKVVVTIEGKPIDTTIDELDYDSIELLHKDWEENFKKYDIISKELKHTPLYKKMVDEIKNSLTHFFKQEGLKTKIIFRTDQWRWGEQSPHDFLPQYKTNDGTVLYRPENQIRIYLDFVTSEISEPNLNQIIAYPEMKYKEFKLIEKPGLSGWDKVNLELIPDKYIFISIKDLMENYRIVF